MASEGGAAAAPSVGKGPGAAALGPRPINVSQGSLVSVEISATGQLVPGIVTRVLEKGGVKVAVPVDAVETGEVVLLPSQLHRLHALTALNTAVTRYLERSCGTNILNLSIMAMLSLAAYSTTLNRKLLLQQLKSGAGQSRTTADTLLKFLCSDVVIDSAAVDQRCVWFCEAMAKKNAERPGPSTADMTMQRNNFADWNSRRTFDARCDSVMRSLAIQRATCEEVDAGADTALLMGLGELTEEQTARKNLQRVDHVSYEVNMVPHLRALAAALTAEHPALAAALTAEHPALAAALTAEHPALAAALTAEHPALAIRFVDAGAGFGAAAVAIHAVPDLRRTFPQYVGINVRSSGYDVKGRESIYDMLPTAGTPEAAGAAMTSNTVSKDGYPTAVADAAICLKPGDGVTCPSHPELVGLTFVRLVKRRGKDGRVTVNKEAAVVQKADGSKVKIKVTKLFCVRVLFVCWSPSLNTVPEGSGNPLYGIFLQLAARASQTAIGLHVVIVGESEGCTGEGGKYCRAVLDRCPLRFPGLTRYYYNYPGTASILRCFDSADIARETAAAVGRGGSTSKTEAARQKAMHSTRALMTMLAGLKRSCPPGPSTHAAAAFGDLHQRMAGIMQMMQAFGGGGGGGDASL